MGDQAQGGGVTAGRSAQMPIARTLGFHFTQRGNGKSELVQPVIEAITFDGLAVQAGAVATIADFAGGAAVSSLLPPDWRISTADMTVKLLAPAVGEKLIARGQALQTGKTISVARADVFAVAGGVETLCATALVTIRNSAPPTARAALRIPSPSAVAGAGRDWGRLLRGVPGPGEAVRYSTPVLLRR